MQKNILETLRAFYLKDVHERDARASEESKKENLVKLGIWLKFVVSDHSLKQPLTNCRNLEMLFDGL